MCVCVIDDGGSTGGDDDDSCDALVLKPFTVHADDCHMCYQR